MFENWAAVLKEFFTKGHVRTLRAKKHIALSLFLKGLSIIVGFLMVPLLIDYLDKERYGIWLTVSSIVGWVSFMDMGLGHGLRNRFGEAMSVGDSVLARTYVSTAYVVIAILVFVILLIFFSINGLLDWQMLLNTSVVPNKELAAVVGVTFLFFVLRFQFGLIGMILLADQKPGINNLFGPIGNLLALFIIYGLYITIDSSLFLISLVLAASPTLILILGNIVLFRKQYYQYRPSLKLFDFSKLKSIMGLGVKFFVLQAGQVVIYSTDNIIISQLLGPQEVTIYFIPFKYFSLITMGFSIIMLPMWSAFTEANVNNDVVWIKNALRKLVMLWAVFVLGSIVMLGFSPVIYDFWVGGQIANQVPFLLSALMAIFVSISSLSTIYLNYLNGIGKVNVQLITIVICAGANIPLSIYFADNLGLNSSGVILASIVCMLVFAILTPIQARMLLRGNAKGIWNK